jgi:hypothetical protein
MHVVVKVDWISLGCYIHDVTLVWVKWHEPVLFPFYSSFEIFLELEAIALWFDLSIDHTVICKNSDTAMFDVFRKVVNVDYKKYWFKNCTYVSSKLFFFINERSGLVSIWRLKYIITVLYMITIHHWVMVRIMVFNATFNNISVISWPLWVRIPLRRDVLDATLCDKVCQWLAASLWFSPGNPVSSTNTTDRHDITEILLKMALNTIIRTLLSPPQS